MNFEDFDDILATGNVPDILKFMKEKNIASTEMNFNFGNVYWLLKDETFYREGLKILKQKNLYVSTFWEYSVHHNDWDTFAEWLNNKHDLKQKVGPGYTSKFLKVNENLD